MGEEESRTGAGAEGRLLRRTRERSAAGNPPAARERGTHRTAATRTAAAAAGWTQRRAASARQSRPATSAQTGCAVLPGAPARPARAQRRERRASEEAPLYVAAQDWERCMWVQAAAAVVPGASAAAAAAAAPRTRWRAACTRAVQGAYENADRPHVGATVRVARARPREGPHSALQRRQLRNAPQRTQRPHGAASGRMWGKDDAVGVRAPRSGQNIFPSGTERPHPFSSVALVEGEGDV